MLLYIDPGTGSMLFGILVGVFATLVFFLQGLIIKIKSGIGGKKVKDDGKRIDYVIFSDDKRYWNSFKLICDEFEKRGVKAEYWTMSEDDPALSLKYEYVKCLFIGTGNSAFTKLNMMRADICLSTTPGLNVYQWKKSKWVNWYVHIYHCLGECTTYEMFGIDFYDAILITGKFQEKTIRKLEELRGIKQKELYLAGLPYIDALAARKKEVRNAKNQTTDIKNILLAPSWGESGLLKKYGEKLIDALLDTGYDVTIRPHPQSWKSENDMMDNLIKHY